jgi:hypothetical protein
MTRRFFASFQSYRNIDGMVSELLNKDGRRVVKGGKSIKRVALKCGSSLGYQLLHQHPGPWLARTLTIPFVCGHADLGFIPVTAFRAYGASWLTTVFIYKNEAG